MNSFLKQIVVRTTLRNKNKSSGKKISYSDYELAKGMREIKINIAGQLKDFVLVTLGIFSAAFGFKGFLLTNQHRGTPQVTKYY